MSGQIRASAERIEILADELQSTAPQLEEVIRQSTETLTQINKRIQSVLSDCDQEVHVAARRLEQAEAALERAEAAARNSDDGGSVPYHYYAAVERCREVYDQVRQLNARIAQTHADYADTCRTFSERSERGQASYMSILKKGCTILTNFAAIIRKSREAIGQDGSAGHSSGGSVVHLQCINQSCEGSVHAPSGVMYARDRIMSNGMTVEGVFPVFDSHYDVQLPRSEYHSSDSRQKEYCNKALSDACAQNPALRSKFSQRSLNIFAAGAVPSQYVWHHHQKAGKMQLVSSSTHSKARHTGGKFIWGGERS